MLFYTRANNGVGQRSRAAQGQMSVICIFFIKIVHGPVVLLQIQILHFARTVLAVATSD